MITTVTQEVFRETQAMSFSRLSKLADGPQAYKASLEEKEFSLGLAFGSVVDILLTRPDSFNNEFYVMAGDKPSSDMMIKFCEVYAETDSLEQAHAASGFKIGLNAVTSKFQIEGKSYYDSLILGKGKRIIDASMMFAGNQAVNTLKSNPFTKKYFVPEDGVEFLHQLPIIWNSWVTKLPPTHSEDSEEIEIKFKGLIDLVRIDHVRKQIEIVDIKTGAEGFWKAFWRYKLYLQGSMYFYGLDKVVNELKIKGYTVKPTKFVYIDSNLYYPPVVYRMNASDIYHGKNGYYPKIYGEKDSRIGELKYKGYERLAAEMDWHIRNDKWDYSYDVYQSDGVIEIDAFNPKF